MICTENNEWEHKECFINTFDTSRSILDWINWDDALLTDITYKQCASKITSLINYLKSSTAKFIQIRTNHLNFMICALASFATDKIIITSDNVRKLLPDAIKSQFFGNLPNTSVLEITEQMLDSILKDPEHQSSTNFKDSANKGFILYTTSGTTGAPKLIKLSQLNVITGAFGMTHENIDFINDTVLFCLDHVHVYEFMMELLAIFRHSKLVYSSTQNFYKDYMTQHPSAFVAVPQILNKLYDMKLKLKLRLLISGGAPIRSDVYDWFKSDSEIIVNGFGMTECAASISTSNDKSNGIVNRCTRLKFAEDNELLIKGLSLSESVEIDADGWFHTNDIGKIENGRLHIIGRKNNIIKLQQGEFINLDQLSEIYSVGFVCKIRADSSLRYPYAEVYSDDELNETEVLERLKGIWKSNGLKGFERPDKVVIRKLSEMKLSLGGKVK